MIKFEPAYIFEDDTGIYFYRKSKKLEGYEYEATTILRGNQDRDAICKTEMDAQEAVRMMQRDAEGEICIIGYTIRKPRKV